MKKKKKKQKEIKNKYKKSQTIKISSARIYLTKKVLRWLSTHIQTIITIHKNMKLKHKHNSKLMKWMRAAQKQFAFQFTTKVDC